MNVCPHMASNDDFCEKCGIESAKEFSSAWERLDEAFRHLGKRDLDTAVKNTVREKGETKW